MCNHIWTARQRMAFGASMLCDRCGAQLNRVWDVRQYPEEEADSMDLVEESVTEIIPSTNDLVYPF